MENEKSTNLLTKHFLKSENPMKTLMILIGAAVLLGTISGFVMAQKGAPGPVADLKIGAQPKSAEQDTGTFRDFAEGTIKPKPSPKKVNEYTEGTHVLERDGAVPVALTSSVVDLSLYEGKKVKVYGETQKALKEGWLMDVGKVEEVK